MADETQSLMRRDTWGIFPRKSVDDNNVLPVTWYFNCKRKPDLKIRKFKARYCVRGGVQKRLYPELLNSYYLLFQWETVRLMLILYCIIVLHSQSIDFTNDFYQADIPRR